jgi:hypothetical protein
LGLAAAYLAGDAAPSYALDSNLVYRAEVGGIALVVAYLVGVAGWLAWRGRTFRVELGPLTADPSDSTGVDEAASGFEDFRDDVYEQIEDLRTAVDNLRTAIEEG